MSHRGAWLGQACLGWAWLMAAPAFAADDAVQKILDCMRANIPQTLRVQEIELNATDRGGGARTLKGKLFAMNDKGLIRAMLRVSAPSDLSGAAYLMRETAEGKSDEMYMFLPALNRVRRISGASAEGSLLGTDFSYNDVRQMETAFGGAQPTLEKPAQIENRAVNVLSVKIKPGDSARYSAMRSWVDQKTCVALKVDFLEGDKPRKELTAPAAGLTQAGNYWYPAQVMMHDLKDNTSTTLKVVGLSSGDLASRYFDPHSFYLGN